MPTETSPDATSPSEHNEPPEYGDSQSRGIYRLEDDELLRLYENHREWLNEDLPPDDERRASLTNVDLSFQDFSDENWSHADFVDSNLRGATFAGGTFEETDFTGADLTGADLSEGKFSDADFSDATLNGATLHSTVLNGATLTGAELMGAEFIDAEVENAKFKEVTASGGIFKKAKARRARFSEAKLRNADFRGARLQFTHFSEANVLDARFGNAKLKQADLQTAKHLDTVDFGDADLREAMLPEGFDVSSASRVQHGARTSAPASSSNTPTTSGDSSPTMTRDELKAHLDANEARVERMTTEVSSKLDTLRVELKADKSEFFEQVKTFQTQSEERMKALDANAETRSQRFTSEIENLSTKFTSVETQSRITRNVTIGALTIILTAVISLFVYAFTRMDTLETRQYNSRPTVQSTPSSAESARQPQTNGPSVTPSDSAQ